MNDKDLWALAWGAACSLRHLQAEGIDHVLCSLLVEAEIHRKCIIVDVGVFVWAAMAKIGASS